MAQGQAVDILLVEDSPSDALITREALEVSKLHNALYVVEDGEEAMAFLRRQGRYADRPRPGLVLLDLNLPKKSGREVLADIKSDDDLKSIPVVVLTTSDASEDIERAYGAHANCYITKPVEFSKLAEVVRAINDFWFTLVKLPSA